MKLSNLQPMHQTLEPRVRAVFQRRLERTYLQAVCARLSADCAVEAHVTLAAEARAKLATLAALDKQAGAYDLPMARLADRLGLWPERVDTLWAIVACSIDGRIVPHLEVLGGAHARRGLSPMVYALLAELDAAAAADLAHWLASPNALVSAQLVIAAEPAAPAARAYVASPRLISYLRGEPHSMAPIRITRVPSGVLYDLQQSVTISKIDAALGFDANTVLVVEGPIGSGRATAVAHARSRDVVVLDCARINGERLADALLALRRESLLGSSLPLLANVDYALGEAHPEHRGLIGDFVDSVSGPLVVTATVPGIDLGTSRPLVRIPWQVPDTEIRRELWERAVNRAGARIEGELSALAHRYRIGPAAITRAVASLQQVHGLGATLDEHTLASGLRHNIAERLAGLAERVEVTQTWEDLVLGEDTYNLVGALIGRICHAYQVLDVWGYRKKIARGTGVAALFSGPPGTGKTMVAGLVARELGLDLYQVDLSKVVSKWIGETEKNLARVFDAAEEGHALLLFDEADALFGQRSSEMRSAVDRYANLEVNYLLQRVEAFGGITILTTNLETAIDAALKRRLASHIVFAPPDEDERIRLWERQTSTGAAPIANDFDGEALARAFPNMSGAHIRNAAISAAFLAAAEGAALITLEHLLRAARAEYRSMGHMVSDTIAARSHARQSY